VSELSAPPLWGWADNSYASSRLRTPFLKSLILPPRISAGGKYSSFIVRANDPLIYIGDRRSPPSGG
jgi:hypothetical protein